MPALREHLVETLRIETDHDLFADDERWSGAAVVGSDELEDVLLVGGHVAFFEVDTSILEVGLSGPARRSTGLGEQDDFFRHGNNG